jgi:hypothetical protein
MATVENLKALAVAANGHFNVNTATVEYPGSVWVHLPNGAILVIGDSNETWMADVYSSEDALQSGNNPDETIETTVGAGDFDAMKIVGELGHELEHGLTNNGVL